MVSMKNQTMSEFFDYHWQDHVQSVFIFEVQKCNFKSTDMRKFLIPILLVLVATLTECTNKNEPQPPIEKLRVICPLTDGETGFVVDHKDQLWLFRNDDNIEVFALSKLLGSYQSPVGHINNISITEDDAVAISGATGVGLLKNGTWTILNRANTGLKEERILQTVFKGNKIYILEPGFLEILENGVLTSLARDNVEFPDVQSGITVADNGDIIMAHYSSGFIIYKNHGWVEYDSIKTVSAYVVEPDNTIWFTYPSLRGFYKLKDGHYQFFSIPDSIPGAKTIFNMHKDGDSFWLGSSGVSFDGAFFKYTMSTNSWTSFLSPSKKAEDAFFISNMAFDSKKNIYFCSYLQSLCVFNENGIR